jgi:glycosyltransferase involved in cell wall biosynthesis
MRRILYLSKGGNMSGSQRQLLYLVRGLPSCDFTPVVVCDQPGLFVDELAAAGVSVEVLRLRPWRKLRHALGHRRDVAALLEFARSRQIDMVHCSYLWHQPYAIHLSHSLGIPLVSHVRRLMKPNDVHKHRLRDSQAVIAISRRIHRQLLDLGLDPERTACIDDAVDTSLFSAPVRPPHTPDTPLTFAIVGRIGPRKYQHTFLQAVTAFLDTGRKGRVLVVGDVASPHYQAMLKDYVAMHGLQKLVTFTGRCEKMPELLSSVDVVVSLSGGSVMYEAMACGCTVISAGFTPAAEAVHLRDDDTGMLLETRDPDALATAMADAADNPSKRARLAANAVAHVRDHLSDRRLVDATKQLYHKVLQDV